MIENIKKSIKDIVRIDNFHPMDTYVSLMKLSNWKCKEIASELNIEYKNKRLFAKKIIELLQYE